MNTKGVFNGVERFILVPAAILVLWSLTCGVTDPQRASKEPVKETVILARNAYSHGSLPRFAPSLGWFDPATELLNLIDTNSQSKRICPYSPDNDRLIGASVFFNLSDSTFFYELIFIRQRNTGAVSPGFHFIRKFMNPQSFEIIYEEDNKGLTAEDLNVLTEHYSFKGGEEND
ncbi:MAG: hypothetical protein NT002_10235 [candidate division Zixibacteria bacterium]|nr:hypothetical protein [candidate division Zixibacteria bacterium]